MIRQAAVIGLSVIPFVLSSALAFVAWELVNGVEAWRMITTALVWIVAFAAGTQLFWRGVERLTPRQPA